MAQFFFLEKPQGEAKNSKPPNVKVGTSRINPVKMTLCNSGSNFKFKLSSVDEMSVYALSIYIYIHRHTYD